MFGKTPGQALREHMRKFRTLSVCASTGGGRCRWAQVAVLGWLALGVWMGPREPAAPAHSGRPPGVARGSVTARSPTSAAADELEGVWRLEAPGRDGDPVHFYYFHGDGTGLYRYGVVGLTNTHSFDYRLGRGGALALTFRKSGEHHELRYRVESGPDGQTLTLSPDPRGGPGRRYRREAAGPASRDLPWPEPGAASDGRAGPGPAGHMWIDLRRHATGGQSFGFYQLAPARIDGRGVGWFHRGDFDEWSTEALTYRVRDGALDLHFTVRGEQATTPYRILDVEGRRILRLDRDPRDFGAPHRYPDAGPSFGARGTPLSVAVP